MDFIAIAPNFKLHGIAGFVRIEGVIEFVVILDTFIVHTDDDVADDRTARREGETAQSGFFCGGAVVNIANDDTADIISARDVIGHDRDADAELLGFTGFDDLWHDAFDCRVGDGESDARGRAGFGIDHGVHADELPGRIEERSA